MRLPQRFRALGIESYDAALPEGRIRWRDGSGKVVAHGRCQAVLSWAATDRSAMWCAALEHFTRARVPVIPPPPGWSRIEDLSREEAAALAMEVAAAAGAEFLYDAAAGHGAVFLAIFELAFGAAEDGVDPAVRVESARRYARDTLVKLAGVVGSSERSTEARALLDNFSATLEQQAKHVVAGEPIADELLELAELARGWIDELPAAEALREWADVFDA